MVVKKQGNLKKAEGIYNKFLFPFYKQSEKFKSKLTTFSVILHSQNLNHGEITMKIDKYSEKMVSILQEILMGELKLRRHDERQISGMKPQTYCEEKHIQILNSLNVNELNSEDSGLSDLEDEILKTCQSKSFESRDIFTIKKEPKITAVSQKKNDEMQLETNLVPKQEKEITSEYFSDKTNQIEKIKIDEEVLSQPPLTLQEFKMFTDKVQDCSIHQPIKTINFTNGHDTWHESRKSSENFIEVEDINSNYSNSLMLTNIMPNNVSPSDQLDSVTNFSRIKLESDFDFKVPRSHKFDPVIESCSNLNLYNKPFIPKPKPKEKLKNLVPFLKEFKPKFLKKENIDKKILRKFRNYVKIVSKTQSEILEGSDKFFWKDFVSCNLLPPMKYEDSIGHMNFKSFNTKYLLWLFSKDGCVKLFTDFTNKFRDQILGDFITSYDLLNNKEETDIIEKLKYYIEAIPEIYYRKNFPDFESTYNSKIHSEELLADYIGCDYSSSLNTFSLNNFCEVTYPRCGPKLLNRDYIEDKNDCESYSNMVDSVMNASLDSIAAFDY